MVAKDQYGLFCRAKSLSIVMLGVHTNDSSGLLHLGAIVTIICTPLTVAVVDPTLPSHRHSVQDPGIIACVTYASAQR
jgi:hypothetical protein